MKKYEKIQLSNSHQYVLRGMTSRSNVVRWHLQLFEKVPQVGEIIHHRLGTESQNEELQIVPQLVEIFMPLHTIAENGLLRLIFLPFLGDIIVPSLTSTRVDR